MADSTKGQFQELLKIGLAGGMPPLQWLERLRQVAYDELTREELQAVISGGGTSGLGSGGAERLEQSLEGLVVTPGAAPAPTPAPTGQFASEEVPSTYGYPSGWQLKPAIEQARLLAEHFQGLDVSHVERLAAGMEVPTGFDGIGVIPMLSVLAAREDKRGHRAWPILNRALAVFLPVIKATRRDFHNYMEGNIGPEHLRLWNGTQELVTALEAETPGDCLVIPVQTGLRHRSKSPRRARVVFTPGAEFGLDPVSMGCLVLTHPERLQTGNELWIDCSGAEYFDVGVWTRVPYWNWHGGRLGLGWRWSHDAGGRYGSASLWRPGVLPSNLGFSAPSSTTDGGGRQRKSGPIVKGKTGGLIEF